MARVVTFLTDYGYEDEFVGVCHGVIARLAPAVRVVDVTHGVARHDVRSGALILRRALPYFSPGVHLAVVDPGVGGERRAVAVRAAEEDRLLVGPDNGLLSLAAARFGGAVEAADVSHSPHRLEPVSATFHGRDTFAPVAARLAEGAPLAEAGEPMDPQDLVDARYAARAGRGRRPRHARAGLRPLRQRDARHRSTRIWPALGLRLGDPVLVNGERRALRDDLRRRRARRAPPLRGRLPGAVAGGQPRLGGRATRAWTSTPRSASPPRPGERPPARHAAAAPARDGLDERPRARAGGRRRAARHAGHRGGAVRRPRAAGAPVVGARGPRAAGLGRPARPARAAAARRGGRRGRRRRRPRSPAGVRAVAIKWPNDVLLERRKVAGILAEGRPQERWAVLGVGLNVAVDLADLPEELRATAATMGLAPRTSRRSSPSCWPRWSAGWPRTTGRRPRRLGGARRAARPRGRLGRRAGRGRGDRRRRAPRRRAARRRADGARRRRGAPARGLTGRALVEHADSLLPPSPRGDPP